MGVLVPGGDRTAVRRTAEFFLKNFEVNCQVPLLSVSLSWPACLSIFACLHAHTYACALCVQVRRATTCVLGALPALFGYSHCYSPCCTDHSLTYHWLFSAQLWRCKAQMQSDA